MSEGWMIQLLNMSFTGGIIALIVMALRLAVKRLPKQYTCLLWLILLVRLLCPLSLHSRLSMVPVNPRPIGETMISNTIPSVRTGIPLVDRPVNEALASAAAGGAIGNEAGGRGPRELIDAVFAVWTAVWAAGALALLAFNLARYEKLKRKLRTAVRVGDGVFYSEFLSMPMVAGLFKPRVYLPAYMRGEEYDGEREMILAHERAHIRRGDPFFKLAAFAALAIHWFHPLVWLSYFMICNDIEMACDERAMRDLGTEQKNAYSMTLLRFSERQSGLLLPLAFGESRTKSRIKNILNYKKPTFWGIAAVAALLTAAAVTLLTNPTGEMLTSREQGEASSISIIGGADGPTSIFLAGKLGGGGSNLYSPVNLEEMRRASYGVSVELDYVSAERISMHGYFGYLAFELIWEENRQTGAKELAGARLAHTLDTEVIGATQMQGDEYAEIYGGRDGAIIIPSAYAPENEKKQMYIYDQKNELLAPAGDFPEEVLEELKRPMDAVIVESEYAALQAIVAERYQSGLLYGPSPVPEYDTAVYGFLAADGPNLEDIWYGMWREGSGTVDKVRLFEK